MGFQVRLTACVFALTSKELDGLMSANVYYITSKLIQTAQIDSDRTSHLVSIGSLPLANSPLPSILLRTLHPLKKIILNTTQRRSKFFAKNTYNASGTTIISLIKSLDTHPCYTTNGFNDLNRTCRVYRDRQLHATSVASRSLCLTWSSQNRTIG